MSLLIDHHLHMFITGSETAYVQMRGDWGFPFERAQALKEETIATMGGAGE